MRFSDLFGVDQPVAQLRRAVASDQLVGTYLFVGPTGVGKTSLAVALAQAAACTGASQLGGGLFGAEPRAAGDGCGECESCRRAESGAHPEIVVVAPAGDQTQLWQFWDRDNRPPGVLQHSLGFAPAVGRKRVFIVERADTLTEQAANSLLKALEEPPPYAHFVLLAPHSSRMLATILSRSHVVRLVPSSVSTLADWLADARGVAAERAQTLAAYAEGRTGAAIRMLNDPVSQGEIDRSVDLAESAAGARPIRALRVAEEIRKFAVGLKIVGGEDAPPTGDAGAPKADAAGEEIGSAPPKERAGRRQFGAALDMLAAVFHDLLALRLGGLEARIIHAERRERLAALSTRRTPEGWMRCIDSLLQARRRVDQNVSVALLTDWLAISIVGD